MRKRAESRDGMIVTTIALPAELHRRLMLAALDANAAATELVRQAITEYLDRRERRGRSVR